ncbi:MAG TPA: MGMT family protein [Verrucomicrobiota bacterium]|nr:hypothetical protein [Verrucomicrobiales bacterium]HRI16731.1 MGMT family protein [Verrucomicrobiota bacterium]
MVTRRKSWREKLADDKDLPKVITLSPSQRKRWGGRTMVIATPREVDAIIRKIPRGRTATINDLRARLAKQHGTDTACPITTGIFSWIAAHAAAEDEAVGKKRITPWWRVLKSDGKLNPKYPGGVEEQRKRLRAEGAAALPIRPPNQRRGSESSSKAPTNSIVRGSRTPE